MKIVFRLGLLAAAAGLGFWLWLLVFPSPETLVRQKISGLAATVTLSASDGNITRATKVSNLLGYFATDAEISFNVTGYPGRTLSGRDEIRATAAAGFTSLTTLEVQFLDVNVHIGAGKQTADVSCTARVNAGDKRDYGVQELHFQLRKIDGDWRITRVETVTTLAHRTRRGYLPAADVSHWIAFTSSCGEYGLARKAVRGWLTSIFSLSCT